MYKPVSTSDDAALFQQDIDRILSLISSSGLSPNVSKTKFLLVSKSRNVLLMDVEVGSHSLPPCESVKYLGVILSSDLSWSEHIRSTCKMANRQLGLIHRKLGNASPRVRHAIFQSTILPRLDYCCAVWDPHLRKDIEELNNTHKFAARIITHHWHDDLPKFYKSLNWISLQTRRRIINTLK